MPRIVLNPFGSLGDLHPYLAVALALQRRGHTPVIATSAVYRNRVEALGLAFAPVRPDVGELVDNEEFMRRLWHPSRGTQFLVRDYLLPALEQSYADLVEISGNADLLITHAISYAGPIVAEKLRFPWLSVALQPLLFLSVYDTPALTPFPFLHHLRPGPALYRAIFALGRAISARWAKPIHDVRRHAGLPRLQRSPFFEGLFSPYGTLALFSSHFAAPQPDWPAHVTVCGFPFYDQFGPESPDQTELQAFLAAGEPPLLFTLGSSAVMQAGSFYRESLKALGNSLWRAVFLVGMQERNSLGSQLPANVHVATYAPFSELMPRCRAVVHQGGIGTTAQALRAGKPMIVVPWSHDQPDNGRRVADLGVGRVLSRKRYNAANITRELDYLFADRAYTANADRLGRAIAAEQGAETACDVIESTLAQLPPVSVHRNPISSA